MSHKKNSKRKQKIKEILAPFSGKKIAGDKAIEILKSMPSAKFDQTVEIAIRLGIDTKQADQQVRSTVTLPSGTGKKIRVAVIAQGDGAKAATEAGADKVGAQDFIKEIEEGFLDFDKLLASPDMMRDLGKLGRVLGPKGLMPNPKDGTVLDASNIGSAVEDIKKGRQVSFRAEKDGAIVQFPIGRLSFSDEDLLKNLEASLQTIQKVKPSGAKGIYIMSVYISSTVGGAVQVDPTKLVTAA